MPPSMSKTTMAGLLSSLPLSAHTHVQLNFSSHTVHTLTSSLALLHSLLWNSPASPDASTSSRSSFCTLPSRILMSHSLCHHRVHQLLLAALQGCSHAWKVLKEASCKHLSELNSNENLFRSSAQIACQPTHTCVTPAAVTSTSGLHLSSVDTLSSLSAFSLVMLCITPIT